jgi:hypothetical protein
VSRVTSALVFCDGFLMGRETASEEQTPGYQPWFGSFLDMYEPRRLLYIQI